MHTGFHIAPLSSKGLFRNIEVGAHHHVHLHAINGFLQLSSAAVV